MFRSKPPFNPRLRLFATWILALLATGFSFYWAWHAQDNRERNDGNGGHLTIDFCGQWLMGRMLALGYGPEIYNRAYQRQVLTDVLPKEDQDPQVAESDVESMMRQLLGSGGVGVALYDPVRQRQLGGAMYPPVNALIMYPLGLLPPRPAYRTQQILSYLLIFWTGLALQWLSRGNIWWPAAVLFLLAYPGCWQCIVLGQNAVLSLTILVWGWYFLSRDKPVLSGVIWGLLAFKPVWAAAFLLVPLLTRRWRMGVAMCGTSAALTALTLPLVGWQCWLDWFEVGKLGAAIYNVDENWIHISRDLLSIPRRWLLDFDAPPEMRDRPAAFIVGWSLWLAVFLFTFTTTIRWRHDRTFTGPAAAFLLLGAFLTCFHFMYYDVLLSALPVFLLFVEPRHYVHDLSFGKFAVPLLVLALFFVYVLEFTGGGSTFGTPWNTIALIVLWMLCGSVPTAPPFLQPAAHCSVSSIAKRSFVV